MLLNAVKESPRTEKSRTADRPPRSCELACLPTTLRSLKLNEINHAFGQRPSVVAISFIRGEFSVSARFAKFFCRSSFAGELLVSEIGSKSGSFVVRLEFLGFPSRKRKTEIDTMDTPTGVRGYICRVLQTS